MHSFVLGYLFAFTGFILGTATILFAKGFSNKVLGTLLSFTAGLLIAFISLELVPEALEKSNTITVSFGIVCGLFVALLFDSLVAKQMEKSVASKYLKSGIVMALGIGLHNIPEGITIGALMQVSLLSACKLGLLITVHCLPEALAFAVPFKEAGFSRKKMIFITCLMAVPMGIGSTLGWSFGGISNVALSVLLSFAAGVMLYVTVGEIIPSSKRLWNGRLSTIGALLGFVLGIWLTS